MVVDGSYGFDDPTETTTYHNNTTTTGRQPPTGPAAGVGGGGGLYSDSLVKTNRWGRGFSSRAGGHFGGR
jgi:hypothetical protein